MSNLPHAERYDDLLVYQKARELQREVFRLTCNFPKDEIYSLTGQIRRSSRSIDAQIAEAWGKRRYENHFVSKLTDADSEHYETRHCITTAVDCGYLDEQAAQAMIARCEAIGRLLGGMIDKARHFCSSSSNSLREAPAEYFVSDGS